jgi:hypothetical protein
MSKSKLLVIGLLPLIALISCAPGGSGYNFIDQPLQGKIGGSAWQLDSGAASEPFADGNLWISLYDVGGAGEDRVFFVTAKNVGLREFSFGGEEVTLIDMPGNNNMICYEGALDIQTIDPIGHVVTGRIDARFDADNYVNGNFTATY